MSRASRASKDKDPERKCCGGGLDALRLRWSRERLFGGRSVLGASASRDPNFFVLIDDESYLSIHGRVPYGVTPVAPTTDAFSDDCDGRAAYFWEPRQCRTLEGASMDHALMLATGRSHSVVLAGDSLDCFTLAHGGAIDEPPRLERLNFRVRAKIRAVTAGWNSFLLLAETGTVYGCAATGGTPQPLEALEGIRCRAIACGAEHNIVCTDGGDAYSWGRGDQGRLGFGDVYDKTRPTRLPTVSRALAATAGLQHSLIICADAAGIEGAYTVVFGDNSLGQLGLGHREGQLSPVKLDVGAPLSTASCGDGVTILVNVKQDCMSCGCRFRNGQPFGPEDCLRPRRLPTLRGVAVAAVSAGAHYSLVAATDGRVFRFGGDVEERRTVEPWQDKNLRVDTVDCHVCRRRDHMSRLPRLLSEAAKLQSRDEYRSRAEIFFSKMRPSPRNISVAATRRRRDPPPQVPLLALPRRGGYRASGFRRRFSAGRPRDLRLSAAAVLPRGHGGS